MKKEIYTREEVKQLIRESIRITEDKFRDEGRDGSKEAWHQRRSWHHFQALELAKTNSELSNAHSHLHSSANAEHQQNYHDLKDHYNKKTRSRFKSSVNLLYYHQQQFDSDPFSDQQATFIPAFYCSQRSKQYILYRSLTTSI